MKIRLKYLVEDVDRHGNIRLYVRQKSKSKIRIREPFGTDAFMLAYNAALAGDEQLRRPAAQRGSFRYVCGLYYASPEFKSLDSATQRWRRRMLDEICESTTSNSNRKRGDNPIAR
jgi:hypothetical protein